MNLNKKVADFMKKPVFVELGTDMKRVAELMAKEKTDVLVVLNKGNVEGIITGMDLFYMFKNYAFPELKGQPEDIKDIKLERAMMRTASKDFMSACQLYGPHPCLMVGEEDTLEHAIRIMVDGGEHHLLVIGRDGKVSGTVSPMDIIEAFIK
ncbi:MAG: CBS domain-containing protein [Candidatus Jordarchaeaceae archaeon]